MPPLVPVTVAFLMGIVLAWCEPFKPCFIGGLGLMSALVGLSCRRQRRMGLVALLMLWACLGAIRTVSWLHRPSHHVAGMIREEPTPVLLHGVVVDDPTGLFTPGEAERQVAVVNARHVRTQDVWRSATGLVRARLRDPRLRLSFGDEVVLEGRWSGVRGPGNPGQFDWAAALARQQIHVLLSVEPFHGIVRVASGRGNAWLGALYTLRHRLDGVIGASFDEFHAGLLRSFLLGQRVALDEQLKQAFVETGTMHLVVISGFNVGLIAGILEVLLRLVGLPLRPRLLCSAIALGGYCIVTGMQPPVTRATIMAWIVLGAIGLDRVINWPNTLAAAALAILCVNPAQLFDPGFQLSFGAVVSLLVFAGRFRSVLEPRLRLGPERLRRYVAISVASTLAIWVGLWPVLAWYFHLVSPVSIVANLVLVPLVSILVGVGTVILMTGVVAQAVVRWTTPLVVWLVELIVGCVHGFHHVPGGWWPMGHPSWLLIGGYYGLVIFSLARRVFRVSVERVILCWLAGLNLWLWGMAGARAYQSRWLEVTVLDVGHGDSIVIRTPNQQTLLVDAGTQDAGRYVVTPFLRFNGVQALDALVLTHPDEDHLGGALPLLQQGVVRRLLTNGFPAKTPTAQHVFDLVESTSLRADRLIAGMRLTGLGGMELSALHPPAQFVPGTSPASNDNSLVVKVAKGSASLLLCGDLEERGVPWLMRWGPELHSTVLKVPHHGSALGEWQRRFFEQIHPELSVISVGRLHHLPAAGVLRDLDAVRST
ncbi:MAG: DNA internalization-related competence protein ComEC/Rec2, partial [Candidatus Omnitrophica bacterium]|nr:DNA internalization-related competence protein ComEC/Rec2 [Candidatus Omnitrophota bacterium]